MNDNLIYNKDYINRFFEFDDWEIMVLQQTQLNAVNQQITSQCAEAKIAVMVLFKSHLYCAGGEKMNLTPSQINDIISRMYRRLHKLVAKKISYDDENCSNAFVPSISGYCNNEQQPIAYLTLGVPINLGRLEFAGLVESVLMECPLVKTVAYSDLGMEMSK